MRLKNGNTLITDEHDTLTVEVSPRKEIVWSLPWTHLGPATAVQILDDSAVPEVPGSRSTRRVSSSR